MNNMINKVFRLIYSKKEVMKKDVKNINLGIYEQNPLVTDKNAVKWGDIDAMAGFDPVPAVFEEKGLVIDICYYKSEGTTEG